MSAIGVAERVLSESAPGKVADAAEKIAGAPIREIEASLPGALAGERAQVRAYVHAYRALTDEMLDAIGAERPDLIVFDSAHRPVIVAELKSFPRPATVDWMKAALEQKAMSAPFSEWVGTYGAGRGAVVELVAHLRRTLHGTEPLVLPSKRHLPDWPVDERLFVSFSRAVSDELARVDAPLEQIASVLGLSQTELAGLFGVRRQAIDQWQMRGVPAERQEKLATLGEIADLLTAKLKRERIPGIVRRPAPAYGDRSILQAIAAGDESLVLDELRNAFDWASAA
jgi:transcriptional regulator with XRE-family HTH domain